MKTIDFLDRVKEAHDLSSDYALSQRLGVSRQQVSKYRSGREALSDELALQVSAMLDMDPGYVVACMHAERARDDGLRQVWEHVADKMSRMAHVGAMGVLAFIFSLFIGGGPDGAAMAATVSPAPVASTTQSLCVMSNVAKWMQRRMLDIKAWLLDRVSGLVHPTGGLTFA